MTTNIGKTDQTARITIGLALIAAAVFGVIGLWGFIGIVLVVTALLRSCPVYQVLGYST